MYSEAMTRRWIGLVLLGWLLTAGVGWAQPASVMPAPIPQFFDSNGDPLAGGSLTFYAAGTTTPQAVYSDSSLSSSLGSVVTLNAAGRPASGGNAVAVYLLSSASYKILLKDSGGSTIWTQDNVAGATYLAQQAALPTVQTTTSTGTQNNFDLSCGTAVSVCILRANNATDTTFTGFESLGSGTRLIIVSVGAGNVYLSHQSGSSTAAYQMVNWVTSSTTPLAAGSGKAEYVYDSTSQRWRLVSHVQGGWIAPTFASTDYTASTGTWTVASGDVASYRYYLSGRTLQIQLDLNTTDVSATPATLRLLVPNSFSLPTTSNFCLIRVTNAGAATAVGIAQPVATQIYFSSTVGGAAWGAAAANTYVQGVMAFEVT